ncbi:hypothetical protein LEM8419_01715 [Neolewinella maritima]|uniref:Uncharacterized protein n=1 Tax=Neolewinella maritima TaxID=1383882 RepID=A0ABN8F1G1_9BACT|nr:hypothetical protein [Neolewinella maritima]CAH1000581.1 hypothetical protein LEM8419_01715 [Neolewinella maritima]
MRLFFFLLLLCLCASLPAQKRGNPALAQDVPLQLQFDTVIQVSNRYREGNSEFRVVRRAYLDAFMANVSDSLSQYPLEIGRLQEEKAALQEQIDATSSEVSERDATIAELNAERDSVNLLGMQLNKGTYSLIMWALVIGLLIALLVALASTRIAAANNTELKRERDKLAGELETSRKSRLTVEQDLRRQLQDEINRRGS